MHAVLIAESNEADLADEARAIVARAWFDYIIMEVWTKQSGLKDRPTTNVNGPSRRGAITNAKSVRC